MILIALKKVCSWHGCSKVLEDGVIYCQYHQDKCEQQQKKRYKEYSKKRIEDKERKKLIKSVKNNKILWDWESVEGETGSCFDKDIIILRDFTLDGIKGKANKDILSENLDTSIKSQNYLNTLFTNGLTNKIVVQMTSDIKEEKEIRKVQDKFSRVYSSNGKIFTVPAGYNVNALNLSLADAQYEQLRRLSKEEIAMSFRVPLSKLGIMHYYR